MWCRPRGAKATRQQHSGGRREDASCRLAGDSDCGRPRGRAHITDLCRSASHTRASRHVDVCPPYETAFSTKKFSARRDSVSTDGPWVGDSNGHCTGMILYDKYHSLYNIHIYSNRTVELFEPRLTGQQRHTTRPNQAERS
jgi:hypothetical protein